MKKMMVVVVVAMAGMSWRALAVPMSITYQGQLNQVDSGLVTPMAGTSVALEVRLWNQAEGGNALWGREIPVTLDSGAFNMIISDSVGSQLITSSLQSVIQNATGVLYIGLKVKGGVEISPRQRMLSAAYAVAAGSAEKSFGNFAVNDHLQVSNGATVTGTTTLQGATAVNSTLTVSGKTDLNGDTEMEKLTVNGTATLRSPVTANSTLAVSGASTLQSVTVNAGSALNGAVAANSTLTVTGAATLNGATTTKALTVDGNLRANSGVTLAQGASVAGTVAMNTTAVNVNAGSVTLGTNTTLEVQGTCIKWYPLTYNDEWGGWNEISFNQEKTPKQDIILAVSGHCPASGDHNDKLRVSFKVGSNFVSVAEAHVRGWTAETITVPIPKGQIFKISREGQTRTSAASIFTFRAVNTNDWSTIW